MENFACRDYFPNHSQDLVPSLILGLIEAC